MISGGSTYGDSNRTRKAKGRRICLEVDERRRNEPVISFGPEDLRGVSLPHNDALVIQARVANYDVLRVFVDNGSSVNVIFKEALVQMDLHEYQLEEVDTVLFGFAGHAVYPEGEITLPLTLGTADLRKTVMTIFTIVDATSSYNIILGRPAMNEMRAVASNYHQKIKFPVRVQVGEVKGDQPSSRKCYLETVRVDQKKAKKEDKGKIVTRVELMTKDREVNFVAEEEHEMVEVELGRNSGWLETWKLPPGKELAGISPQVVEHKLNIIPGSRPVMQKKRPFGPKKDKVIDEQVHELLKAGHIRKVQFPSWLSNVVLVRKATGKWRMCVDFWDLNKACPKDCYPLHRIDQLVDSTSGCELLSFLDAYQGYHKIPMAREDQDKASFITSGGTFCYVFMPFELKNAGATYQRLMNRVFQKQIGRNIEVYVDDILIKTQEVSCFVDDMTETFTTPKHYAIKLNPAKCVFGVKSGKFLGFMAQKFGWDEKCEQAFQDLKKHLAELLVLVKPEPEEKLWIYLSATEHAVSSVLIREERADQKPVYYVSHALRGAELNYSETEKIALALVMTARKLRPYFLSHPIVVLTNSPLERIMTHAEISGRMVEWTIELGEYDIEYKPRIAIKAQALTDFLIEMTQPGEEEVWRVFVDGEKIKLALRIDFQVTNYEAEYEAVLARLQAAREVGATRVIIYSDSQLVAQQIKGTYEAKNEKMLKYLRLITARAAALTDWSIEQIPREENGEADTLAKLVASMSDISTREVLCFTRLVLSIDEKVPPIQRNSWMTPLIEYIVHGKLPEDRARAAKIKKQAPRFVFLNDVLYRRSYQGPLLKCLSENEVEYVLQEIHEGCCGEHLGGTAPSRKAVLAGF
ncbi:uncharacterized protein [Primulina huaijiensis]|uniref:uncharacterized protein n=1 Tax=Primulina huaijiensis TaxID=1492673 RepID=UPI003CC6E9E1